MLTNSIYILKILRNILGLFTLLLFLAEAYGSSFISKATLDSTFAHESMLLSIPFLFLIQALIVFLVSRSQGKPVPEPQVVTDTAKMKDAVFEDAKGKTPWARILRLSYWYGLGLLFFVWWGWIHFTMIVTGLLIVATYRAIFHRFARITFRQDGVLFESSARLKWNIGRKMLVPYHNLYATQPAGSYPWMALLPGYNRAWPGQTNYQIALTFHRNHRRMCTVSTLTWNPPNRMPNEVARRLPPEQRKLREV